jgi:signal transduction histidine kinase
MSDVDRLAVLVHELRSPLAALMAIEQAVNDPALPAEDAQRLLLLAVSAGRDIERLLADPELFSVVRVDVDVSELLDAVQGDGVTVRCDPGLAIVGDPVRLRQALRNLIGNGLRHGEHVLLQADADDREVTITVADDGPGVAAGIDPFARGVSGVGSTGLGLYVARTIAEAHGGSLELVTAPGAGATFRLALPRASAASG